MRKLLILASSMLTAACAAGTSTQAPVPMDLDARLIQSGAGHVAVALTQPAHLAVFEFVPGVGAFLLYPSSERDAVRLHGPGVTVAHVSPFAGARSMLGSFARASGSPRYLYVIASLYPLATEEFIHSPARLRDRLGHGVFASFDGIAVLGALQSLVLTNLAPGTWAADLHVIWPTPPIIDALAFNKSVVTCPDGQTFVVQQYLRTAVCAPFLAQLVDRPVSDDPVAPPPPKHPRRWPGAHDRGRDRERGYADRSRRGTPRGEAPWGRDRPQVERPQPDRGNGGGGQTDRLPPPPPPPPTPPRDPIQANPPAVAVDN